MIRHGIESASKTAVKKAVLLLLIKSRLAAS